MIPCQNWTQINRLPRPLHQETLRRLFFPTATDINEGYLNHRSLHLPSHYTRDSNGLPSLQSPCRIGHITATSRRPGFLDVLNDTEYCDAYRYLVEKPDFALRTWEDLHRFERTTMRVVTGLLGHVLTWFQSDWTFPEKADDRRKMYQWANELSRVVLIESPLEEGSERGFGEDQNTLDVAESIIREIWRIVDGNSVWSDKRTMAEVSVLLHIQKSFLYD